MNYVFRTNQLNIFNVLINDASISLKNIENLKLVDNCVAFDVDRRAFENVTRKQKRFGGLTYLNGKTSSICIENVTELFISELKEEFKCNHFIVAALCDSKDELQIESVFGLKISLKTTSEFIIRLHDIKDSDFGGGIIHGACGYTKEEWLLFLMSEKYYF